MDSIKPSGNETRVRRTALVIGIALAAAWSGTALSRTQPAADCGAGSDLLNLSAPVETLVLDTVDHVPTEPDVLDLDSIDIKGVTSDSGAPTLNLAPRFNDTMHDIFDEDSAASVDDTSLEIPVSPIAESEEIPDLSELPESGSADGVSTEESDLPLLERQMYRIDI
ncbi:MAG: hypothetical protein OEM63_02825 [Gammaproteobacteria bacterium]|nr:hypothetical protein [Gammaproteobacteria bacterium]